MKYCKECNMLKIKWNVSQVTYQTAQYGYDKNGAEDFIELYDEIGDMTEGNSECQDCNAELEEKEMRKDTELNIIKYMKENKIESINPKDTRILKYYL